MAMPPESGRRRQRMGRLAMIIFPLLLSAQLVMVSDTVPQFDVTPGCRAANERVLANRNLEACRNDEDTAKSALSGKWTKYTVADRTECENMVHMGGPPSYVELLTCLDLAQQTKDLKKAEKLEP
jgi:hypothetical protein